MSIHQLTVKHSTMFKGLILAQRAHILAFDDAKFQSRDRRSSARVARGRNEPSDAAPTRSTSRATAQSRAEKPSTGERKTLVSGFGERRSTSVRPRVGSSRTSDRETPTEEDRVENVQRTSKRDQRRRSRAKTKAARLFEKQNASAGDAASEEGAPRAALYEGKMGATQRKSSRMQRASEAVPSSAKINPAGWFSNLTLTPRSVRVATIALCVVLLGAFLYVPAQQYYQAQREHDRLTAEYAVIEQRNQVLDQQNDSFASDAGMEDAVRQKYGYVKQGDQAAVVTGLSDATTDTSRDGEKIEANVLSSSVKAPEQWYTPILDAFFGVE